MEGNVFTKIGLDKIKGNIRTTGGNNIGDFYKR